MSTQVIQEFYARNLAMLRPTVRALTEALFTEDLNDGQQYGRF